MGPTKVAIVIRRNKIEYRGRRFNALNITMLDSSLPSWCKWDTEDLIITILDIEVKKKCPK
jgi:hypothetical protein